MRNPLIAGMLIVCSILALGAAPVVKDEAQVVLTLEKVSAPFAKGAKVYVEQKNGKLKAYSPSEHKIFDKEIEDRDLEMSEYHIKDREIVKIVFTKKLPKDDAE